jgi:OPT oligopeptide transporter protein
MVEKYDIHAPFYLTEFFVIGYWTFFLTFASVLSHVALWHGSDIYQQLRSAMHQLDTSHGLEDTHNKIMRDYWDLPEWAYLIWLGVFSAIAVLVCQITPYHMPWWATLFAIGLGICLVIPLGIVQAITGTPIGINNAISVIIGYIIPGDIIGGFLN